MNKDEKFNLPCPDPEGCKHFKAEMALEEENKRLRELLKESQCPDILYCNNGTVKDAWGNEGKCNWCEKRDQALQETHNE